MGRLTELIVIVTIPFVLGFYFGKQQAKVEVREIPVEKVVIKEVPKIIETEVLQTVEVPRHDFVKLSNFAGSHFPTSWTIKTVEGNFRELTEEEKGVLYSSGTHADFALYVGPR